MTKDDIDNLRLTCFKEGTRDGRQDWVTYLRSLCKSMLDQGVEDEKRNQK